MRACQVAECGKIYVDRGTEFHSPERPILIPQRPRLQGPFGWQVKNRRPLTLDQIQCLP